MAMMVSGTTIMSKVDYAVLAQALEALHESLSTQAVNAQIVNEDQERTVNNSALQQDYVYIELHVERTDYIDNNASDDEEIVEIQHSETGSSIAQDWPIPTQERESDDDWKTMSDWSDDEGVPIESTLTSNNQQHDSSERCGSPWYPVGFGEKAEEKN